MINILHFQKIFQKIFSQNIFYQVYIEYYMRICDSKRGKKKKPFFPLFGQLPTISLMDNPLEGRTDIADCCIAVESYKTITYVRTAHDDAY